MEKLTKFLLFSALALFFVSCGLDKESEVSKPAESIDLSLNQKDFAVRTFSEIDLYSTKRISEHILSPDGQWIVYRLSSPSIAMNRLISDLYAVKADGSETIQLTNDLFSDMSAQFSPDGKQLSFVSTREETPQIFVMDFPKGTPKKVTSMEEGVTSYNWSPTGEFLVISSDVKVDSSVADKYPNYKKANVLIYDDIPARHWDEWNDEKMQHLFIVPVNNANVKAKDIMEGEKYEAPMKPFGGAESYTISPDGNEVAYTCKKVDDYEVSTNSEVYIYDNKAGTTINISEGNPGYDRDPQYSPDGKYIAFLSQARAGFESDRIRLIIYDRATKKVDQLSKTLDQWVEQFIWSPDSKNIYFVANDSGTVQLYSIDLNGNWKTLTRGAHKVSGPLTINKEGTKIILGKESYTEPKEIYSCDLSNGNLTKITKVNDDLYKNIKPINVAEKWFKSTDGKDIHSWVLYPPDFDSTKKYPMITYLQGGPQSQLNPNFHFRWNLYWMASKGYIVVAANRRGVPGFGQQWNDAISLDWGGKPMQDYLDVTDQMSKEPYVNTEARAAVGASAGGYAAFWMAGNHNKRFKALMAHCGVFNVVSKYGATEELFFPNWEFGGPYWIAKNRENMEKNSPINFVQNWDTPILISTGMNDFRVPYTQSLEAFTAARGQGIPAELLVFPEETHFIAKPQEFLIWGDRFFKFLDKYCKK